MLFGKQFREMFPLPTKYALFLIHHFQLFQGEKRRPNSSADNLYTNSLTEFLYAFVTPNPGVPGVRLFMFEVCSLFQNEYCT